MTYSKLRYLFFIVIFLVGGCSTKPVLERENIRYLRVNDIVEVDERSLYDKSPYGSSGSGGGGSSGHAAAAALQLVFGILEEITRDRDALKKHMEGKGIYISDIIKKELDNQLSNKTVILVDGREKYDALLTIKIARYGVDKRRKMLVFREYKPYLDIVVKLTHPVQGRTIWKHESVVSAETDEVKGYSKKLYFSDGRYMQDSFKQAAGIVVEDAIKPLFSKE